MDKNAGQFHNRHMAIKRLKLSLLLTDAGTQTRSEINPATVEEYSAEHKNGAKFPPMVAFYDKAKDDYYLVDGFHRHAALEWNGVKEYAVDVLTGDLKAAIKFALGRNNEHGLRRTNEDKRYAVKIGLREFPDLSARELAKICAVSDPFVLELKKVQVLTVSTCPPRKPNKTANSCPPRRVTGADGKSYPAQKSSPPPPAPVQKDETKLPIPPEIIDAWDKANQEADAALNHVSALRSMLRTAQEDKNLTFTECDFTDDLAKLDTLFADLKRARPFAVCFSCNGVNFKDCTDCKRRGFISEHYYKVCVPKEKKKITKRFIE
jgi:ParB/Sulfiredoxin domain